MARKLAAVMFLLGGLQATSALSLGLGALQLQSFLNEPLNASVDLLDMGGLHADEVIIRLASRDDFDKFGMDRPYFLSSIKFEVSAQDNGAASIILSSDKPVLEPYLEFILEARWPSGRLLREYTVLIDLPLFSEVETVAVSAAQRVDEIEKTSVPTKKNNEVISSGTSVEIRSTDLAPGAMPQRDYTSNTASSPVPGSRYMIRREDTLWRIASLARPQGASVQQTMLDIQRLNPDAFVNGNINTVKAGYIVYLPSESDISSTDASSALAEVREQNAAWLDGRDVTLKSVSGPSLTISAEAKDDAAAETAGISDTAAGSARAKAAPAPLPVAETYSNDGAIASSLADEMQERLFAIEQQLQTLQRVVSLKDDQIAALQNALVAAGAFDLEAPLEAPTTNDVDGPRDSAKESVEVVESDVEPMQENLSIDVLKAAPVIAPEAEVSAGWLEGLLYFLGVVALGIVAFIFVRRRNEDDKAISQAAGLRSFEDVFSTVQLKEQGLNVEESEDEESARTVAGDNRDASERHDYETGSDLEAANVLADVDIYVVYGRHSQAIDLLNSVIASEPDNSLYRLKLLEVEAQSHDHGAAHSELEIEGQDLAGDEEGDLGFSTDFSSAKAAGLDSEELVIAADGFGLSTKLDLARAYIDMGDDEAARQILEEVVAEGTDDLKVEASALLDRIGE
ncbi:MAG: FimV/HubP family polar landmark protein [Halioglobus sp.]|jgi:pilus assembly protein FimV